VYEAKENKIFNVFDFAFSILVISSIFHYVTKNYYLYYSLDGKG